LRNTADKLLVGLEKGFEKRRKCSDHSQDDENEGDDENFFKVYLVALPKQMKNNPGNEPDCNGYGRLPAERASGNIERKEISNRLTGSLKGGEHAKDKTPDSSRKNRCCGCAVKNIRFGFVHFLLF